MISHLKDRDTGCVKLKYKILISVVIIVLSASLLIYCVSCFNARFINERCNILTPLYSADAASASSASSASSAAFSKPNVYGSLSQVNNSVDIISISNSKSATIRASSSSGYFETVVYKYPEWEPVFSETSISELHLDSLENGKYTFAVFSPDDEFSGEVVYCKNTARDLPTTKIRLTPSSVDPLSLPIPNSGEIVSISLPTPVKTWPATMYTIYEAFKETQFPSGADFAVITTPCNSFFKYYTDFSPIGEVVYQNTKLISHRVVISPTTNTIPAFTVIIPNAITSAPDPISKLVFFKFSC